MYNYRLNLSPKDIFEIYVRFPNYEGFRGEMCVHCLSSFNLMVEPDVIDEELKSQLWLCPKCGGYSYFKEKKGKPFRKPTFGVPLSIILEMEKRAKSNQRFYLEDGTVALSDTYLEELEAETNLTYE